MKSPAADNPVIVSVTRTPIGRAYKGSLAQVRADDLAAQTIRSAVDRVEGLQLSEIDELYLGCGEPRDEQGGNMARRVAVMIGADSTAATTVNRFCASSIESVRMASNSITAGSGDAFVAAGVESISRYREFNGLSLDQEHSYNPIFTDAVAYSVAHNTPGSTWVDPRREGRLPNIYMGMGQTAENVAGLHGVSRADQDEYAARSQRLTHAAQESGFLGLQITSVELGDGRMFERDESPRPGTTTEGLAGLATPFREGGSVTAGNACGLSDGASALVMMSEREANKRGVTPLARVVATSSAGLSPEIMGLGPLEATNKVMARLGATIEDFDLIELNEAFSAQVLACQRLLGIDLERLNVFGGSIALGHPFGATGIRLIANLVYGLRERDLEIGLATLCVGGGQGMAMVIERLS